MTATETVYGAATATYELPCGAVTDPYIDRFGFTITSICTLPVGHSQPCRWLKR